jgi:hypothetical protein
MGVAPKVHGAFGTPGDLDRLACPGKQELHDERIAQQGVVN